MSLLYRIFLSFAVSASLSSSPVAWGDEVNPTPTIPPRASASKVACLVLLATVGLPAMTFLTGFRQGQIDMLAKTKSTIQSQNELLREQNETIQEQNETLQEQTQMIQTLTALVHKSFDSEITREDLEKAALAQLPKMRKDFVANRRFLIENAGLIKRKFLNDPEQFARVRQETLTIQHHSLAVMAMAVSAEWDKSTQYSNRQYLTAMGLGDEVVEALLSEGLFDGADYWPIEKFHWEGKIIIIRLTPPKVKEQPQPQANVSPENVTGRSIGTRFS